MTEKRLTATLMSDGGGSGEFGQLGAEDSFSNGRFYTAKSKVLQLGTRGASYSVGVGGGTLTLSSTEGVWGGGGPPRAGSPCAMP